MKTLAVAYNTRMLNALVAQLAQAGHTVYKGNSIVTVRDQAGAKLLSALGSGTRRSVQVAPAVAAEYNLALWATS